MAKKFFINFFSGPIQTRPYLLDAATSQGAKHGELQTGKFLLDATKADKFEAKVQTGRMGVWDVPYFH